MTLLTTMKTNQGETPTAPTNAQLVTDIDNLLNQALAKASQVQAEGGSTPPTPPAPPVAPPSDNGDLQKKLDAVKAIVSVYGDHYNQMNKLRDLFGLKHQ